MLNLILTEVDYIINILLGDLLSHLGRKEDAINDYTKVIEMNPQDA